VPSEPLKLLQRKINDDILSRAPLLPCVFGGVPGKSVVGNASLHVGQPVVFSMDIEQCFPSIVPSMVRAVFQGLGFGPEAAGLLTVLTTWNSELPQGAPTSTMLANLVLLRIDWRILKLQKVHVFNYSRWVDDLTFSGGLRLLKLRRLLQRIVEDEGFRVKPGKIRTMLAHDRQVVTKLIVNTGVNLPRETRSEIKKEVISAAREGDLPLRLSGRMHWLKAVNPAVGANLIKKVAGESEKIRQAVKD